MGLPECKECPENFNPRAPRGARHFANVERKIDSVFQSTRPSRGATAKAREIADRYYISIHAPLAGRDSYRGNACQYAKHFNPRAPRGARPFFFDVLLGTVKFQSTRPSRGATLAPPLRIGTPENFNPRAPRGARPVTKPMPLRRAIFQSTRPSRGATRSRPEFSASSLIFQSTRPSRGATLLPNILITSL